MKDNKDYILRYIKGTLSDAEIRKCDALMSSSPDFAEQVNNTKEVYHLFDHLEAQKKIDTEAAWNKLESRIKRDKRRKALWNITRNAAAILLPLFVVLQYVVHPLLKEAPQQEIITLYSAPGIVTKTQLPDGSEVWLNAQSELSYPSKFTGNERSVQLMGEAYFKVVANQKNRFNVITDNATISAYGTEFNVNAYNNYNEEVITLANGNIDLLLANQTKSQKLMPGHKAIIDSKHNSLLVAKADTYVETAWKDGKMVFRRENIGNIAKRLSQKFGVDIVVKGNVTNDYQLTATFTTETLEDILELLKLSASLDYTILKQEKLGDETFSQKVVTIECK